MALLGGVYTIDRYLRTPQEVFAALFRQPKASSEQPPSRPQPCFKHIRAALVRDDAGTMAPQVEAIFGWMAQEVKDRTLTAYRPLLLPMDGQDSLRKAGLRYLPQQYFEVIEILDLLHALSYVWKAVHLFRRARCTSAARAWMPRSGHPVGSRAALRLAKKQVLRILCGEVKSVIRSFRRIGTRRELSGKRLEDLERICGYLRNNAARMAYGEWRGGSILVSKGGSVLVSVKGNRHTTGTGWWMD